MTVHIIIQNTPYILYTLVHTYNNIRSIMIQAFYFLLIIIPWYLHIHYIICIQYHIIKQFYNIPKNHILSSSPDAYVTEHVCHYYNIIICLFFRVGAYAYIAHLYYFYNIYTSAVFWYLYLFFYINSTNHCV